MLRAAAKEMPDKDDAKLSGDSYLGDLVIMEKKMETTMVFRV